MCVGPDSGGRRRGCMYVGPDNGGRRRGCMRVYPDLRPTHHKGSAQYVSGNHVSRAL